MAMSEYWRFYVNLSELKIYKMKKVPGIDLIPWLQMH